MNFKDVTSKIGGDWTLKRLTNIQIDLYCLLS